MPATRCSPALTALARLAALAISMGIGRFAFTPILPMMQADAGRSMVAGSWLASANDGGNLLGAASAIAARPSVPTAIRGGLVTIGITTVGMGVVQHLAAWMATQARVTQAARHQGRPRHVALDGRCVFRGEESLIVELVEEGQERLAL